jgi:hypothetical protein
MSTNDGLGYTPGTGATVATDRTSAGEHVQIVKLAVSADGSASPVTATADGMAVVAKQAHKPVPYKRVSNASLNATSVTTTANTLLYGYYISNTNSAVRYVKFYNKASAPGVGTDVPVLVLAIPGGGAANASFPAGINFTTGLALAMTTGAPDSDVGAVAANEVIVNLVYATY